MYKIKFSINQYLYCSFGSQAAEIQETINELQKVASAETGTIATMREFKNNDYPIHFKLGSKQVA